MPVKSKKAKTKTIATLRHEAKRKNLPTAEYESLMRQEDKSPVQVAYERRNRDLDPQFVWRGKDDQDWSDLVVPAPPLYIQEKVHPKVLVDDLLRQSKERAASNESQIDFYADFNGLPKDARATEFYQHDAHWTNRMILGDALLVMASLAEREGLRGKVQCIYLDPPYGIEFNSNFQWSTTSRNVTDGKADHITREPEQVKAFRDTWRDGIHSYLTYLRDRLTVIRDLLADSGSIFVQIGDANVHRVRALMDEIFQEENFCSTIFFSKKTGTSSGILPVIGDQILWYAKSKKTLKFRRLLRELPLAEEVKKEFKNLRLENFIYRKLTEQEQENPELIPAGAEVFRTNTAVSPEHSSTLTKEVQFLCGVKQHCGNHRHWKTGDIGLIRLEKAFRLDFTQGPTRMFRRYFSDSRFASLTNVWTDTRSEQDQVYVVQTQDEVIARCVLMSTDPGDLVLDPTCGSGTTAYVAEQWGRRWITIDTSRVALALARARIMGARYPFYLLADSREGQIKEGEVTRTLPSEQPTHADLRHGFVYERAPKVELGDIANNVEIDVIWEEWQKKLEPLREQLNKALKKSWQEWEIPREAENGWPKSAKDVHAQWWEARIARQKQIDASIAAKAEFEFLYDKPYEDKSKVRVSGPFTVESISPHRVLTVDENDNVVDNWKISEKKPRSAVAGIKDFASIILENLKLAGVQQAHKEDRITFTSLIGWPGNYICAEGRYLEGKGDNAPQKRAAIFIGPEFGTVSRPDLVAAAREASDANFDVLITCAFNYDAHSAEFEKLGRIPVLKARMNPDLHMADELKTTGSGNLFVVFGEPDIEIEKVGKDQLRVQVKGVDVFKPQTGEVISAGPDGIACWMIDTDYNEESFFVRHAYFLGQNDPYQALKTSLKAEIDLEAWETLNSDVSRPFAKPTTGRIAVKVINHLGDEVMKVFQVK